MKGAKGLKNTGFGEKNLYSGQMDRFGPKNDALP